MLLSTPTDAEVAAHLFASPLHHSEVWAANDQRFELLGGPRGELSCVRVGDRRRHDVYRGWTTLLRINRALTWRRADSAQRWAWRTYSC